MLARLSALVARYDALRQRNAYRITGVLLGLLLAALIMSAPTPLGLSAQGQRTLAVAAMMALWWLGGFLPITVTALVPLVAFPALQVAPIKEVAAPYGHPILFLMLGGFFLGQGMERVGLHHRVTGLLLRIPALSRSPRRVVLGLMITTAVLSGLISNTATTLMMMPLALHLADSCELGSDRLRARSAFALALAYAASIGGVATLVGTFPNAVLAQFAGEELGVEISFGAWALVGVPYAVISLPIAWWIVTRMLIPAGGQAPAPSAPRPWQPGERAVIAVVSLTMIAWLTRKPLSLGPLTLPGWSQAVGFGGLVDDAWVAILGAGLLFLIPSQGGHLLDFRHVERHIPWSVLFLLGGGFALAQTIKSSELATWLAGGSQHLASLPAPVAILALCLGVTFLTELTSNTATAQILLPLLAAGAIKAGVDPLIWMVPATISASAAFMMPVATPPNAIAAEGGEVSPGDMASAGLALNLVLALVTALIGGLWAPLVLY